MSRVPRLGRAGLQAAGEEVYLSRRDAKGGATLPGGSRDVRGPDEVSASSQQRSLAPREETLERGDMKLDRMLRRENARKGRSQ
jgi:hypothetical protein